MNMNDPVIFSVEWPAPDVLLTMGMVAAAIVVGLLAMLLIAAVFMTLLRVFVPRQPKPQIVYDFVLAVE